MSPNDDNKPRGLQGGTALAGVRYQEHGTAAGHLSLLDHVYSTAQNAELKRANADLSEQMEKLCAKVELRDEALCLYSEVVRILEAERIVRPKEVNSLLARIQALTQK